MKLLHTNSNTKKCSLKFITKFNSIKYTQSTHKTKNQSSSPLVHLLIIREQRVQSPQYSFQVAVRDLLRPAVWPLQTSLLDQLEQQATVLHLPAVTLLDRPHRHVIAFGEHKKNAISQGCKIRPHTQHLPSSTPISRIRCTPLLITSGSRLSKLTSILAKCLRRKVSRD